MERRKREIKTEKQKQTQNHTEPQLFLQLHYITRRFEN